MKHPLYAKDPQGNVSRVLTPRQAADRYSISIRTLQAQRYRKQGIPFVTYHKRPFYLESQVKNYLKDRPP